MNRPPDSWRCGKDPSLRFDDATIEDFARKLHTCSQKISMRI